MDKKKRNTLLLVAALVVILGATVLIQAVSKPNDNASNDMGGNGTEDLVKNGMVAVIQQEGQVLMEVSLDEDRDFIVQHPTGGYNAIHVKDGKICVSDADCPDLTCVRTGNAYEEGQVIACLPHRLIIYIEQEK